MKVVKFFVFALMAMSAMTTLRAQTNPNAIVGTWESDQKDVRMEYFQDGEYPASTLVRVDQFVRDGALIEIEADVVMPRADK